MSNNYLTNGQVLIVGDDTFDPGNVLSTDDEIVGDGGVESVWSGGVTDYTAVGFGGVENVLLGGDAVATSVFAYGVINVSGAVVTNNGTQTAVKANTFVSQVHTGGVENVDHQGVAYDSTILGGVQNVESGGVSYYTSVGGSQTEGYGFELVYSGGVSDLATVGANGVEDAYLGGTVNNATIQSGGTENVFGVASSTIIDQGGVAFVYNGGVANSASILGGVQTVYAGGVANNTNVSGSWFDYGFELIDNGGVSNHAVVGAFGVEDAYFGAMVDDATVLASGTENVFGTASTTLVYQGGNSYVYSGGVANKSALESGDQTVYSGGIANSSYVGGDGPGGYGFELVDAGGVSNSATVGAYGVQDAYLGGVVNNTTVLAGGTENVFGVANSAIIDPGPPSQYNNTGGAAYVYSGGVANNFTVNGGLIDINAGGATNGTTINAFGVQNVSGVATDTTINAGSNRIYAGLAIGSTIGGEGFEEIYGGESNYATIQSGGVQDVRGGVATGTTIQQGGAEIVYAGGTANNVEIDGGTLHVYTGGQVLGTTTFGPVGAGSLVLQQASNLTGAVAGFFVGDTFDLQNVAFGSSAISYAGNASSGILSIGTGSQLADIELLGNYIGATFAATSDGHGGTSITETLAGLGSGVTTMPPRLR